MNGRTIRNLLGVALMALGVLAAYFALFLLTGPGAGPEVTVVQTMILQVEVMIIAATLFLSGLIVICTGGRQP